MFIIEAQGHDCRPTNGCDADNMRTPIGPAEMRGPTLCAWIIEWHQCIGDWVLRIGARTLKFVAAITGGAEVFRIIAPPTCLGNNVVNNKGHTDKATGRLAIFAAIIGAQKDLLPARFG